MSKFTRNERNLVKSIVANLTIKRIPESEILDEIHRQTQKAITRKSLYNIKQSIKRDSFNWYSQLREGQYEYLHEFRERMMEIMDLQKKAHAIIDNNENNPSVQLEAIAELRKLNVLLSNYYSVAPSIGNVVTNDFAISTVSEDKTTGINDEDIIV